METHRCPACDALVVDRRSPVCTACKAPLPAEWIMTAEQAAKVAELDRDDRRHHAASMADLDGDDAPVSTLEVEPNSTE